MDCMLANNLSFLGVHSSLATTSLPTDPSLVDRKSCVKRGSCEVKRLRSFDKLDK